MTNFEVTIDVSELSEIEFSSRFGDAWLVLNYFQLQQFRETGVVNDSMNCPSNRVAAIRMFEGAFPTFPCQFIEWICSDERKGHHYWGKLDFPKDLEEVESWMHQIYYDKLNVEGLNYPTKLLPLKSKVITYVCDSCKTARADEQAA